jgi:hypothetical protein
MVVFSTFSLIRILMVKLLLSDGTLKVAFIFSDESALSAEPSVKCQGEERKIS